jgi:O-antigen/teichoic acid export membrane protein
VSAERSIRHLASLQVVGKIFSLAAQLLTLAALTRVFGTADFGAFATGWALMLITAAVGEFGIPTATILELSTDERRVVEPAALGATILSTGVSLIGGLFVAVLLLDGLALATALALVPWMLLGRFRALGQGFAQASHQVQRIVHADLTLRTITLGGAIAALTSDMSADGRLIVIALAMFIGEVAGLFIAWDHRPQTIDLVTGFDLIRTHRHLGLVGSSSAAHARADQVMFGSLRANAAGGVYALAYRLIDAALAVVIAAAAPLLPILRSADPDLRKAVSRSATAIAGSFALVVGALLFISAEGIVLVMAGEEFRDSIIVVRILVAVLIISVINMPLSQLVIVQGATAELLRFSLIAVVANISLNLWLIPAHGASGAAASTLATELGGMIAVGVLVHRRHPGVVPVRTLATSAALAALAASIFLLLETEIAAPVAAVAVLPLIAGVAMPIREHIGVFQHSPAHLVQER